MIHRIKHYDFILVITPILLTAFGLVMIYSASMVTAVVEGYESNHYLIRQSIWFIIGMVGFLLTSMFPYKYYHKLIKLMIPFIILLLLGIFFLGTEVNQAKSWYIFGPFSFQPSEFAKIILIIYLASAYSKKQGSLDQFNQGVLPPLIMTGIIVSLIILQPDIGTASIVFLIACSVILSSGIHFKHLAFLIGLGVIFLLLLIPFMQTDERLSRFTGAYQPFESPDTDGYQLIQSYLAIGVGGLTGQGLGQSVQKLGYLTQEYTDFIMAVIAEELGFFGVLIVIGLLATIVLRGLYIARKCKDSFGALLAIGISSMVGIQAFINLGAISGLLPITGVPLPFVSYGGSSLLVMLVSMGILNNVAINVRKEELEYNSKETQLNQQHRFG